MPADAWHAQQVAMVIAALRIGSPLDHAIAFAGIARRSFYRWKATGEKLHGEGVEGELVFTEPRDATVRGNKYVATYLAVTQATGAFVVANLATIDKAAKAGTWQAAAWRLERRFPAEFANRQHVALEPVQADGGGGRPFANLSDEAVAASGANLLEELLEAERRAIEEKQTDEVDG